MDVYYNSSKIAKCTRALIGLHLGARKKIKGNMYSVVTLKCAFQCLWQSIKIRLFDWIRKAVPWIARTFWQSPETCRLTGW